MTTENSFQELANVNTKTFQFRARYLKQYLRYLFTYFFFAAPMNKWSDCFSSSHRVAYDIVRAQMAIELEKDCFAKNALRNRFSKWGENKLNEQQKT